MTLSACISTNPIVPSFPLLPEDRDAASLLHISIDTLVVVILTAGKTIGAKPLSEASAAFEMPPLLLMFIDSR